MFSADLKTGMTKRPLEEDKEGERVVDEGSRLSSNSLDAVLKRIESLEIQTSLNSSQLRMLQAWSTKSWLIDKDTEYGKRLLAKVELWKEKQPKRGPHPFGACRAMVGLACVEDAETVNNQELAEFLEFHKKLGGTIAKIGEQSVNLASAKLIKKTQNDVEVEMILLKVRPMLDAMQPWQSYFRLLDSRSLETLDGPAPQSTEERAINRTIATRHPKKAKKVEQKNKKPRQL